MVWSKAGSTTLGSAGDAIDVTGMTANKFNAYLTHAIKSGSGIGTTLTLDGVGGTSYALRYGENGSEGTRTSQASWILRHNADDQFDFGYISNITDEEKLMIGWHISAHTVGVGQAPSRSLFVGNFVQNAQFTQITNTNDQAGSFDISSNLSVLGSDGAFLAKPTDVQDNSILFEKDIAKRYWFDAEAVTNSTASSLTDVVFDADTMTGSVTYSGNEITLTGSSSWVNAINANFQFNNTGTQTIECVAQKTGTSAWIIFGLASAKTVASSDMTTQMEYAIRSADDGRTWIRQSSGNWTQVSNTADNVTFKITNDRTTVTYYANGSSIGTTTHGTPNAKYYPMMLPAQTGTAGSYVFDYSGDIITTTPATWTRPKPWGTYGVFAGGYNGSNVDVIDYITIATTGNATDFGDMFEVRRAYAGLGNDTRGLWAGGYAGSLTNTISYVTIATPSNATDFGNLTHSSASGVVGAGNNTRGIFGGGESPKQGIIDYVTIATAGNATDFGDLTSNRKGGGVTSDQTKVVFLGGESGETVMDYVTIDTPANATAWGTLTAGSYAGHSGTISDGTTGIFAIGGSSASGSYNNTIVYKTIATNANALDFGDLTSGRGDGGQCSNGVRGVIAGGKTSGGASNVTTAIDYITIATAGNATSFGSLTVARNMMAGCSDAEGL